jgi:hypothetical protein
MLASPAVDHPLWLLMAAGVFGLTLGVGLAVGAFAVRVLRKYLREQDDE